MKILVFDTETNNKCLVRQVAYILYDTEKPAKNNISNPD